MQNPIVIDTTQPFDPDLLLNGMIYKCYVYNRQRSPDIAPERWELIFGKDAILMETEYQRTQ